jgi:hypothetical protein
MSSYGLLLLLFLVSCGKTPENNAGVPIPHKEQENVLPDGSNVQGLYLAKFITLNRQVNGTLPGSATIMRKNNELYAYVRLFGGGPGVWHQQNIHEGTRCPSARDDLNADGFIDAVEGEEVWGQVLVPLDSNISSQKAGSRIYPVADQSGSYFYERVTSFDRFFSDLKSVDKNLSDNFRKLLPDEGLSLLGKVVIVHGVSHSTELPPTIGAPPGMSPHKSLPIACGIFKRVTKIPGRLEGGTRIDLPESPRPAPVPEVEPTPTPAPSPDPAPVPPENDSSDEDSDEEWYDRIFDWWRDRWDNDRSGRRQRWGDGRVLGFLRS